LGQRNAELFCHLLGPQFSSAFKARDLQLVKLMPQLRALLALEKAYGTVNFRGNH